MGIISWLRVEKGLRQPTFTPNTHPQFKVPMHSYTIDNIMWDDDKHEVASVRVNGKKFIPSKSKPEGQ